MNFVLKGVVAVAVAGSALAVKSAAAAVLFDNGPLITGTSTTGVTTGEPISAPELYNTTTATAGISVKSFKGAEDFVLSSASDLDTFTVYAFVSQSSTVAGTKIPTVTSASVNLWNTTPVTGGSPMLATNLTLTPLSSVFVGWRESPVPGGTVGTRPLFAYTFSLNDLPNGGLLDAGTYWLEWQLTNTTTSNVFTPLVSPRAQAFDRNFRLFGPLSGSNQWFETWEGGNPNFPAPCAAPFQVNGSVVVPEPEGALLAPIVALGLLARRRRA